MYIDSPNISGSLNITGSILLNGTAVTASGGSGGSGAGFPFSGSAVITGSLFVSGGNLSGSFAGDGAGLTGLTINQFATVNDTFTNVPSHSVVHNFGTKDVFVQVFESDDTLLIPQTVTTTNTNQVDIVFGDVLSGRVVIGKAGHILQDTGNFVSSSTAVQTFTNATTASINHYLDSFNVITQVFDSNNNVIVPSNIKVATKDRVDLTFASSRSGKVVIAKAGHIVSGTAAVSASYAETSSIAQRVRAGSSGSRPLDYANIQTGSLWYNTDSLALEAFTGVSASWWQPIGSASVQSYQLPTYAVDFLVVAGGGASNRYNGGGAGAGGLRTSYGSTSGGGVSAESDLTFTSTTTYTITVGAGGTQNDATAPTSANDGGDSSIAGSGITTITSIGGGAAGVRTGDATGAARDGGSGGGGGSYSSGGYLAGSGTSGQGYNGANGVDGGSYQGGGGGGASAAGTVPNGGNGLAVSITGTSTTYAGGGGAGANSSPGSGGTGGGGDGASSYTMNNGAVNTGGGGGGGAMSGTISGGNGGSGVVILRMPTSKYTGTTTGSPTVATDGTDTILVFNSSGTYTA